MAVYALSVSKQPIPIQSHIQCPQASWSVGGCWERLWGIEVFTAKNPVVTGS